MANNLKVAGQVSSFWLALAAFLVLVTPSGMTTGLPAMIAGTLFVVGGLTDLFVLFTKKTTDVGTAKLMGGTMVFSCVLNFIGAAFLFFPVFKDPILAMQIAAGIAGMDLLFESIESIQVIVKKG